MCKKCNTTPCCCPEKVSLFGKRGQQGPPGPPGPLVIGNGNIVDDKDVYTFTSGITAYPGISLTLKPGTYLIWCNTGFKNGGDQLGTLQLYAGSTPIGGAHTMGSKGIDTDPAFHFHYEHPSMCVKLVVTTTIVVVPKVTVSIGTFYGVYCDLSCMKVNN
jgi:hypothetical protein